MGVPHCPHVASFSTWWQPKNCTNLGAAASWSICMLPHWHLQQWHRPELWTCWSTVLKNCRTRKGDFIVWSWWRWHTQHCSLWRPDLVASCLPLVSWIMHFAEGTKWSSVVLRSLPSMANATDSKSLKSVSVVRQPNRWLLLLPFYQISL